MSLAIYKTAHRSWKGCVFPRPSSPPLKCCQLAMTLAMTLSMTLAMTLACVCVRVGIHDFVIYILRSIYIYICTLRCIYIIYS
jgi:hypothetical protein